MSSMMRLSAWVAVLMAFLFAAGASFGAAYSLQGDAIQGG
jgi:hypothetical protein